MISTGQYICSLRTIFKIWFWENDKCNLLHENVLNEEFVLPSPWHNHNIILITKNVDNRMPPKVGEWNQWQSIDFVSCMCVSRTKSTSSQRPANIQASAEYHIYQFWGRHSHTQIIDWWHHKQRSWPPIIHCGSMPSQYSIATWIHCGSMRQMFSQDDIAMKHTQWIYVSQIIHTPLQPGS